ncbi:tRNA lysidine(34) synthetase TilS [Halomonas sp. PAMB 3264]|uniref:tRNA lysidine(34) synthetase TilS n=1 Tax=Halomonas sp. PAMB 3264 TaxID=3075222 RepID=UPI00289A243F|nr:tRNA lysidine(34) synthetase TilS [Halomonas sp. PAMB 3264]WNL42827.1 tRNA lysidine(34) synthetase TilS [Halomonas sp. PAMB 3264]
MAPRPPEPLTPLERLLTDALAHTAPGRSVWVALSGGLDSTLLLALAADVCQRAGRELAALHVNHGLQAAARDFEVHCRTLCESLGVALEVAHVDVALNGEGLEAAARAARYRAFETHVPQGDTLWLAQHQNDQAETFLLGALRGSGVRGLAGMPERRQWRGRTLVRPWLERPRAELEAAAWARSLDWYDDPTNDDLALLRNRLRHRVLPALGASGPRMLARSARLAGEADALLFDYAVQDLEALSRGPGCLEVEGLRAHSPARQRLLIRTLCQTLELPTPPAARLESLLEQLGAADDARVHLRWPGAEARRWRGGLYLMAPRQALPAWQASWNGEEGIATPLGPLGLKLCPARQVTLRFRRGGEVIDLAGRGRRDLKRLLQEAGLPPWRREGVIVVMEGERCLAALAGPDRVTPDRVTPDRVLFQARDVTLIALNEL